jgi:hypothetical protein
MPLCAARLKHGILVPASVGQNGLQNPCHGSHRVQRGSKRFFQPFLRQRRTVLALGTQIVRQ